MTFAAATANAVRYTGADVVFADCDPDNGLMTLKHAQDAAARVPEGKTLRAVFCVHMNGQCTDMAALYAWCRSRNLFLLEDSLPRHRHDLCRQRRSDPAATAMSPRSPFTRSRPSPWAKVAR